eukprot:gene12047-5443_t
MRKLVVLLSIFLLCAVNASKIYGSGANTHSRITGNGDFNREFCQSKSSFNFENVNQITSALLHTMVLKNNGEVYAYGSNNDYQHGDNTTNFKIRLIRMELFPKNITQILATRRGTYAVTKEGYLYGCGLNQFGQMGDGIAGAHKKVIKIANNTSKVVEYNEHKALLTQSGEVYTAGRNNYGQLGDGTNTNRILQVKYAISFIAIDVAVGEYHTIVLTKSGTIYGSGSNSYHELGINDAGEHHTPVLNPHINNATSIYSTFRGRVMAIANNGTLYTWGNSFLGTSAIPKEISFSKRIKHLSLYERNAFVISEDNELFGIGDNSYGEVNCSSLTYAYTFSKISGGENVSHVTSGAYYHIFIKNNVAYASGINQEYQLPISDSVYMRNTPVAGNNFSFVAGLYSTMVLDQTGSVYAYGYNQFGFLNLPSNTHSLYISKTLYQNIIQIAAGYYGTVALKNNGELLCVGGNNDGQCGNGNYYRVKSPTVVMKNVTRIFKGFASTFSVSNDTLYAMGVNTYGVLGVGNSLSSNIPRKVLIDNVAILQDVSTIREHMLVLINGSVFSSGHGTYGALGLGDTVDRSTPTLVSKLKYIAQVSAGFFHSIFMDVNGIVYGCGSNTNGQVSLVSRGDKHIPIVVAENAIKISTIYYSTSILNEKGQIYSFGHNQNMELGRISHEPSNSQRVYPFYRYNNIFSGYEVNFWSGCPNGFYGDYCENNYLLDLFNQLCIDC